MIRRLVFVPLLVAALVAHAKPPVASGQDPSAKPALTPDQVHARLSRIDQLLGGQPPAAESPDVAALNQRVRMLKGQLELQAEDSATKALNAPVVAVNDNGLAVRSADSNFEIKLRGTVQGDQRTFFNDNALPQNDTFLLRLVRPTLEGSLGPLVGFHVTPEFAGDSATLVEAYVDLKFDPRYTLRVGKFTAPVGLERLASSSSLPMVERGFPTELAPNHDIGIQLQGELANGRVSYAAGVFNGTADGRDAACSDGDNNVEFEGRVFFEPWKNAANALSGLGFGIGASRGNKHGTGANFLPRYRTPGQNVFFSYRRSVAADGSHQRFSPQAWYYRNALGLLGEYISSEQEVRVYNNRVTRIKLKNTAWQLSASWVLTGEDASYNGVVKPSHPFTHNGEGWGAFELAARVGGLDIDDQAVRRFDDPSVSARSARAWGLGLNWYLTSNLKLVFNHTHASFDGGAPLGADREDEKTFFSRLQVSF